MTHSISGEPHRSGRSYRSSQMRNSFVWSLCDIYQQTLIWNNWLDRKGEMKIGEYIEGKHLTVPPPEMEFPPSLLHNFKNDEPDVQYFANADRSRIAGICKKRGCFAVWKSQGITSGEIDKDYPTLDSW